MHLQKVSIHVSQHSLRWLTWTETFCINPSPIDKIFDLSKLKAFADDKINVTQKLKFALGRAENIVGKGENAGYLHFLLCSQCFKKLLSKGR